MQHYEAVALALHKHKPPVDDGDRVKYWIGHCTSVEVALEWVAVERGQSQLWQRIIEDVRAAFFMPDEGQRFVEIALTGKATPE